MVHHGVLGALESTSPDVARVVPERRQKDGLLRALEADLESGGAVAHLVASCMRIRAL